MKKSLAAANKCEVECPMKKIVVSVNRCQRIDNFDSVSKVVSDSIHLIGGLESLISRGDKVLIKPNILSPYDYKTGAVTNPYVIKALCRLARDAGARKLIIAEGSNVGSKTKEAFIKSGISKIAEEENTELVDLKDTKTIYMGISNGRIFRRIEIPEVIMQVDVIINVPVMKTHDVFPATLGLKNMKGVLQEKDKKRFHKWGLAQSIVDLNKLVLPQLTVIDGTVAMEGMGPAHGTPVNFGIIISSSDTVAADTVAASVMGIDPVEIEYIRLAAEQGLGCTDLSQIKVLGLSIDQVKRPFKRIQLDFEAFKKEGIEIYEAGACSGCRQVIETLLVDRLKGNLNLLKGYTLIFGQTVEIPKNIRGKLLCFGSCTRKYKDQGEYIPGCPPHPFDFIEYLRARKACKELALK
jgi:uncharacterized protein (DUF362 family)